MKKKYGPGHPLYDYHHRKKTSSSHKKVKHMARHRYRSRSSRGGFGVDKLFSVKNILLVVAASYLAPKVLPSVDPKIVTAAAGFIGAGPIGAVAGYVASPMVNQVTNQLVGSVSGSSTSSTSNIF